MWKLPCQLMGCLACNLQYNVWIVGYNTVLKFCWIIYLCQEGYVLSALVCLFLSTFAQKVMNGFAWNFLGKLEMGLWWFCWWSGSASRSGNFLKGFFEGKLQQYSPYGGTFTASSCCIEGIEGMPGVLGQKVMGGTTHGRNELPLQRSAISECFLVLECFSFYCLFQKTFYDRVSHSGCHSMECGKIVHFINCLFAYLYLACTLYAWRLKRRLYIDLDLPRSCEYFFLDFIPQVFSSSIISIVLFIPVES